MREVARDVSECGDKEIAEVVTVEAVAAAEAIGEELCEQGPPRR